MFICIDPDDFASTGKTLQEAYDNYCGDFDFDDLTFYEAKEIQVRQTLEVVPVVKEMKK